jgi:dolichol-phosphate mannosyltransferase
VYALLVSAGTAYTLAAIGAFCVAVVNNYAWNRRWTFSRQPGRALRQGLRFLTVSVVGLVFNLALLHGLVAAGLPKVLAQAVAVAAVTPWSFVANKLWSFRS